jgi:hypothetical protein
MAKRNRGGHTRKPSDALDLTRAGELDKGLDRQDPPGAGPLDYAPPATLPEEYHAIWFEVIEHLPRYEVSKSDRYAIEMLARTLATIRANDAAAKHNAEADPDLPWDPYPLNDFKRLSDIMAIWLGRLAMTPTDRAKMAVPSGTAKANKYKTIRNQQRTDAYERGDYLAVADPATSTDTH